MFSANTLLLFSAAGLLLLMWQPPANDASAIFGNREKRQTKVDTTKKGFTSAEKTNIVRKHNSLRTDQKGNNMRHLTWDNALAAMAQNWTNLCNFAHGQPATPNPPFNPIGQNLYAVTGGYDEAAAVQNWYSEIQYFNYTGNVCNAPAGKACGHYTQVVWAQTYRVGCGITFCPTLATMTNAYFIACNYGPAGNYVGQIPFAKGTPCAACPNEALNCVNGTLCAMPGQCATAPPIACPNLSCPNGFTSDTCVCL